MRKLTPEILDLLPHNDPEAIKSRRDLRRVNRFMGNENWFLKHLPSNPTHITEIGAGEGHLLSLLKKTHPAAKLIAYDLAPRPDHLPGDVSWHAGDAFAQPPAQPGGLLIANLFLHHFNDEYLAKLNPWFDSFEHILINEPLRSPFPQFLGKFAYPFIHPITRHDMRVSIEAGFRKGEIPALLDPNNHFKWQETTTLRGSMRCIATR